MTEARRSNPDRLRSRDRRVRGREDERGNSSPESGKTEPASSQTAVAAASSTRSSCSPSARARWHSHRPEKAGRLRTDGHNLQDGAQGNAEEAATAAEHPASPGALLYHVVAGGVGSPRWSGSARQDPRRAIRADHDPRRKRLPQRLHADRENRHRGVGGAIHIINKVLLPRHGRTALTGQWQRAAFGPPVGTSVTAAVRSRASLGQVSDVFCRAGRRTCLPHRHVVDGDTVALRNGQPRCAATQRARPCRSS